MERSEAIAMIRYHSTNTIAGNILNLIGDDLLYILATICHNVLTIQDRHCDAFLRTNPKEEVKPVYSYKRLSNKDKKSRAKKRQVRRLMANLQAIKDEARESGVDFESFCKGDIR